MKANHNTSRPFGRCAPILLFPLLGAVLATPLPQATGQCCSKWVISCDYTMDQDETYDCVHILPTGRLYTGPYKLTITGADGLRIDTGGRLFVSNSSGRLALEGGGTSTVNGRIHLRENGSELEIDEASHTLEGSGQIIGENNGAKITIAAGKTLTSAITIEGALQIRGRTGTTPGALGRGTFVNNGVVNANDATVEGSWDRLTLYSGTFTGTGEYKVTVVDAYLEFSAGVAATGLTGPFTVSDGTFVIKENVRTRGGFTCTSPGLVDVDEANGKWFRYNYDPGPPEDYDEISSDCACPCD